MTFGLILGTGGLPQQLVESLKNESFVCVHFLGNENPYVDSLSVAKLCVPLGYIGAILDFFKHHDVDKIVIVGGLKRPHFSSLKTDAIGREWIKKLSLSFLKGDDGLLKGVIKLLEQEGFSVVSAKDLIPNLTLSSGVQTRVQPSAQDMLDIQKGQQILNHIAELDIGQAVVIEDQLVLGVEAVEGTQNLIQRVHPLKRLQKGGVLVKLAKLNQTDKADLPTIGVDTIIDCAKIGLNGIAIDSNQTQIIQKDRVLEKANELGIFIFAF